jgi:cytochrome c
VIIFLVFAVLTFNIIKDQSMFANSAKVHFLSVNKKAEEMINKKAGENLNVAGVNPEEIFNTKCSACHKFDVKLVGPPYQETIPKYNNDVKKLSAFIYNPQKINTAYPPMPNQGLKQKEADAVAQWLISKVSGKK